MDNPDFLRTGQRLRLILDDIQSVCRRCDRDPDAVRLIAVSKRFPVSSISEAVAEGQLDFGESYLQEAVPKIEHFATQGLRWHFIGRLQRNKVQAVVRHFDVIHSVSRWDLLEKVNQAAELLGKCQRVFLQVNISNDPAKAGFSDTAEFLEQADCLSRLDHVSVLGLMTIPAQDESLGDARMAFAALKRLSCRLQERYGHHRFGSRLSMGMSGDYAEAIAEGATDVRVGTAVFGERMS